MNKVLTYIKSGRGIGAKYLLIYVLIIAFVFGIAFKSVAGGAVPVMQKAADQLLPIKIENGVIVEPVNTVKSINLGFQKGAFPFILDTTVDSLDASGLKDGVYITRKALYVVGKRQTKVYNYEENMTLDRDDYTDLFRKIINWSVGICSICVFIFLYVLYLALTSFYALFALVFAKIFKAPIDYCGGMRLSALAYILTSAVLNLLRFSGLEISLWTMFFSVLILQVLALKSLTFVQETPKRNQKI